MSVLINTENLDKIESKLPPIGRELFKLNRTIARTWFGMVTSVYDAVTDAGTTVAQTGQTSARTVAGQARAQTEQVAETSRTAARTVAGQARAEGGQTVATARDEVTGLLEAAEAAVDDSPTGAYEKWTKAELYARAQELDIEGRSTMSKAELVAALRS